MHILPIHIWRIQPRQGGGSAMHRFYHPRGRGNPVSGGGAAIPRRQSAHPRRHADQPIRGGNQPIRGGNQGAGIRFRGGALLSRGGNQPIRVVNQGAGCYADAAHPGRQSAHPGRQPGRGNPVSGGRCYPAAAISPSLTAYQPIRVVNPAGCYADAAHPGRQSAQP